MNTVTRSPKRHTLGLSADETVCAMPFNEKNLKSLFGKRVRDDLVNLVVKDERSDKAVEVNENLT